MDGNLELFIKLGLRCRAGCGRIVTRDIHGARGSWKVVDRIRAGHFNDGSTDDSREFLTANPAPCICVVRLAPFPVRRVYSDTLGCHLIDNLVSCKAAMSMLSLCSSQLMMAVFLESFTRCRLSERTGQLAKRKVGDLIFVRGILLLCFRFPSDFHAYY